MERAEFAEQVESLVEQVIDDLTSRGAMAGAFSLIAIVMAMMLWYRWTIRLKRQRAALTHAVLITGSRGKSSTVRLLHSAMSQMGLSVYAKTTGTAAEEIACDGTETPTTRLGQVSVLEMLQTMDRAFADEPKADVLVGECMAVTPSLISLISDRMVRPDVVVITNAQLDHLEEEGHTEEEIAASMCSAIRPNSLVITGEDHPGPLAIIQEKAAAKGARVVHARAADVPADVLAKVPHAHPQNVAMTLAVTRECGIPADVAIAGMAVASEEPGEREVWRRNVGDIEVTYLDLGAINDPASLLEAIDHLQWPFGRGVPRIGLLNGRWDRPQRALEFAGLLEPGTFDGLIVTGGPVYPIRRELVRRGWEAGQVLTAVRFKWSRREWGGQVRRLATGRFPGSRRAVLVSLENEHEALADHVREYFHAGQRIQ